MYVKAVERKRRRQVEEEDHAITAAKIQAYGRNLEMVNYFKYLRRFLTVSGDDWRRCSKIW